MHNIKLNKIMLIIKDTYTLLYSAYNQSSTHIEWYSSMFLD